ncbi:T9SS type A sorting domain-containing protein [Hymenobacter koreensis]|uniref:Secretion system C-terminal sorting domain-containing protein n=1 Tax=Hymenobacter koreensis TaxID=1084523 RepID=A0ABP8JAZ7_9BACT
MKKFVFLLALLGLSSAASAQWALQPLTFSAPDQFPYRFSISNPSTAWTIGFGYDSPGLNQVARTIDGGQNWSLVTVPGIGPDDVISGINALDANTAWISVLDYNGGGRLLQTTNGGTTWTRKTTTEFAQTDPNFVHFFNANEGVAMGDLGESAPLNRLDIYTTTDGGTTWQAATAPAPISNENGVILAPSVIGNAIWFATDEGRVYRSSDKGRTWNVAALPPSGELFDLAFRDLQNGLAMTVDNANVFHLHRTTDGGVTWPEIQYTGDLKTAGIDNVPGTNTYIAVGAGDGRSLPGSAYSTDEGATWISLDNLRYHTGVAAFSPTTIWSGAVNSSTGAMGVYKLTTTVLPAKSGATTLAMQAFPNPSANGLINVQVPQAGDYNVRVTDALGREVVRRRFTDVVSRQLALDLSQQPAGLYTIQVNSKAGVSHLKIQIQ